MSVNHSTSAAAAPAAMSSAELEPWVKAVHVQDTVNTYYITLEHVNSVSQATEHTRPSYELVVVDASQSRAWHGSFKYLDIHDAVLQEHMADLRPLEVDSALANCFHNGQITLQWSGVDGSQLRIDAMYRRLALAPVLIRLPPQSEMQVHSGQGFNELNARVLNLLLQQNARLQTQSCLQARQLQALTNHVQKVHDSYSDAVASIAANLVCEHAQLSPSTRQQTAAAAAAASPAVTGNKRQRVGAAETSSLAAASGQHSHGAAAAATLSSPAAGIVRAQQAQHSPLPFGQNQQSQKPLSGAANGQGTAANVNSSNRQLDRTPSKGKSRQMSSEEKLKQRIVNTQRRLQQDWEGWLQQLLQAQDAAETQAVVGGSLPPQQNQQQQQQVAQCSALQSGMLQGVSSSQPTQQMHVNECAILHGIPTSQVEECPANVAASTQGQQLQLADADARLVPEQHAQQQAGLVDSVPGDDGSIELEPAVVVRKARNRGRAVGGALAGLRKR